MDGLPELIMPRREAALSSRYLSVGASSAHSTLNDAEKNASGSADKKFLEDLASPLAPLVRYCLAGRSLRVLAPKSTALCTRQTGPAVGRWSG